MSDAAARLLSPTEEATLGAASIAAAHAALRRLEEELRTLPDKPEETSVSALRALWHLAAGTRLSAPEALVRPLPPLDGAGRERVDELVAERLEGTPLAYITERQRFMGIDMLAGPGALIPRAETEILGRTALALATRLADDRGTALVMDVCTGSANLAAAIALLEPRTTVAAADLSDDAVALARRNVEHLGVDSRVSLRVGDLLAPFDEPTFVGRVDLLTCNPPYISSGRVATMPDEIARHEPSLAFDGGPLGVRILQRLMREAPRMLRPGGWLAFEVGLGQAPSVADRLRRSGSYTDVETVEDGVGQPRVLVARSAGSA